MADKDLRHLAKSDLIDIIYQLKKTEMELREELRETNDSLAEANAKLRDRNIKLQKAGSIAEAVVGLNDIFAVAQKTADDYLTQLHAANAELEERCTQLRREIEELSRKKKKSEIGSKGKRRKKQIADKI